eukprot:TRINITY_DN29375_c0_g1_i1.p1 TRINITY_DN29375_c0_g1~~TRINITY_DN29375_c0_g1_i1.p1  ORF type:complete len:170 (+),score=25.78 TRINITY_DN29375_c0_g1_i1:54-512(+)
MSITVFVRPPIGETLVVDVEGTETLQGLYYKVGEAVGVKPGTFDLHFEGAVVACGGSGVTGSGLYQEAELHLVRKDPLYVRVGDLVKEGVMKRLEAAIEDGPRGTLILDVTGVMGELYVGSLDFRVKHLAVGGLRPGGNEHQPSRRLFLLVL